MASRDELQTLKRGLQALAILNADGPCNVAQIARRLDVPRANAHRIINTLSAERYCRRVPNSHLYIANVRDSALLAPASVAGLITGLSIDVIDEIAKETKWPLAVSMAQGPAMISRLATHLANPLSLTKITPGHLQPMLEASTGIVYLAGLQEEARRDVLNQISAAYPTAFSVWQPHFSRVFSMVPQEGYFIMRRVGPEASLGVPIMLNGRPIAGIAMRYMKSCLSRAAAVEVYLPRLLQAAAKISSALERSHLGEPTQKVEPTGDVQVSAASHPLWWGRSSHRLNDCPFPSKP